MVYISIQVVPQNRIFCPEASFSFGTFFIGGEFMSSDWHWYKKNHLHKQLNNQKERILK